VESAGRRANGQRRYTIKSKRPISFTATLLILTLLSNLLLPINAHVAQASNLAWSIVDTPGIGASQDFDIVSPSEVNKLAIGSNGVTFYALDIPHKKAYGTWSAGVNWYELTVPASYAPFWNIAVAPDDVNFVVAISDDVALGVQGPKEVWLSDDGGKGWNDLGFSTAVALPANEFISCVDISPQHGGGWAILVGTRDGAGGGDVYMSKTGTFSLTWRAQGLNRDIYAARFSPTYASDACIVVVASATVTAPNDATAAYIGAVDLAVSPPTTNWGIWGPVEVKDPTSTPGNSPGVNQIVGADLELPTDFSGQSPSLRRMYISIDASAGDTGIFRIDDTYVYELMDTTNLFTSKRISSIAYYGTYASGKLLAGEVLGRPCTATVPTWFTDSPTVCPIPCWYPALKPTTGAAGVNCNQTTSWGNAQVFWSPTLAGGGVTYAATSSANFTAGGVSMAPGSGAFPGALRNSIQYDESAFGLSRNNGETWNQLSLIDTKIDKFTDVAPSADCSTVYLASSNNGTGTPGICDSFDSVWRSSSNSIVTSPLAAEPVGSIWERVYCRVTATTCEATQSDYAILRLVPSCDEPTGQIVFWAAGGTGIETGTTNIGGYTVGPNTQAAAWSPDYGDFWATFNSRLAIQDMAAQSNTDLHVLSVAGLTQKLPYTGTAWASTEPSIDTRLSGGHSIIARTDGKVLVGSNANSMQHGVAYSLNGGTSFSVITDVMPTTGNVHVAFDRNNVIYAADDAPAGSVYRNTVPSSSQYADMMAPSNGAIGSNAPHPVGQFGLQLAFTGADKQSALYSAHRDEPDDTDNNSGVCRTLWPLDGMPKPGIIWDCMDVFVSSPPDGVQFTLEPWSLKICGCCTVDTDTTLWAIDNSDYNPSIPEGMLWAYTDCLAKKGPALVTNDKTLIGCDPVSGRNQQIDLCWEQLCVATTYDIEIAKDSNFTIRVIDWATADENNTANFLRPVDVLRPCCYFPAGGSDITVASAIAQFGNLECNHTYYWRVQVRSGIGNQIIRSPWSEARSFTLKAGLPVQAAYEGLTLLAPKNNYRDCPVSPVLFSWSPFINTAKYKFVLAKDAALTDIVVEAEVANTAYEYEGTLDYSASYFWRVMAIQPAPSEWSATFSFRTQAQPAVAEPAPKRPLAKWIWPLIAVLTALFICIIVFIVVKPRYPTPTLQRGKRPDHPMSESGDKPKWGQNP